VFNTVRRDSLLFARVRIPHATVATVATVATALPELTRHMMGSHSVTCHPAEVAFPPLSLSAFVAVHADPEVRAGGEAVVWGL